MDVHADKQRRQQHSQHGGAARSKRSNIKSRWASWVEEQNRKNEQRASKPDNIIVLKFAVVLCVGLLVWCYYVYVGRICTPMIRQDSGARGSRAEGIAFLIIFNILWLLMSYNYALVCWTPPGYAKDVVEKGPRPEPPRLGYPSNVNPQEHATLNEYNGIVAGPHYMPPPRVGQHVEHHPQGESTPALVSTASDHTLVQAPHSTAPCTSPSTGSAVLHTTSQNGPQAYPLENTQTVADKYGRTGALGTGIANAAAALDTNLGHNSATSHQPDPGAHAGAQSLQVARSERTSRSMPRAGNDATASFTPKVFREPPNRLPLHPNSRYCERCEIVKPFRAHHCRHCGTCILGMDHHCPWIGQCCGARNHIFFVVFCFWSCIALGYVFVTLLIALIAPNVTPKPESIDIQAVVICAIAAVLSFFTGSMTVTHVVLILNGQSTIENISIGDMKHRETSALNRHYSLFAYKAKARERQLMDREWGKLDTEAHLWFQGDRKTNWTSVMGDQKWKWLLPPPGYIPDDGVDYTPNPRHGPNGEWRRRQAWPKDLQ